jgi:hypothetical protein
MSAMRFIRVDQSHARFARNITKAAGAPRGKSADAEADIADKTPDKRFSIDKCGLEVLYWTCGIDQSVSQSLCLRKLGVIDN